MTNARHAGRRHSALLIHHSTPPPLPTGESGTPARIVLSWLIRLRWFAVVGQIVAIIFARAVLDLHYPAAPLAGVLATTLLTNVFLLLLLGRGFAPPAWVTPSVLVLDVALLTAILYFTGGPENPFAVLYTVHVAMATVVLGPGLAWAVVLVAGGCYGLLFLDHYPIAPGPGGLPAWASALGQWASLLLVAGLLAYFIGRVAGSLQRREQELSLVREQAALSERLASLTTLAAGAAHELGTPLGTIAVVAKELELSAHRFADESVAEDARLIRQQVERCRNILEHMRGDIAGSTTAGPGSCEVEDVIDGVRSTLRPDRQGRLTVEIEPGLPLLAVPCRAAQQAVQFLVNNAFDASSPDQPVELGISRNGPGVRFRVADQGTGMDAETLRRASEPFFTTKDPGNGMGLGLFLVRLVAERHGGQFDLQSTPGRGSVATLVFPCKGVM